VDVRAVDDGIGREGQDIPYLKASIEILIWRTIVAVLKNFSACFVSSVAEVGDA
jgi:hypothetical protein